jgi:serine/threonine protein kinase
VYSLGIILFELLSGRRPYTGTTPTEVLQQLLDNSPIPDVRTFNDKVSPKVSAVLSLMCAKRAEDRMATPRDVIVAFARLGYALQQSGETEFAAEEDKASSGMVQDLIPDVSAQKQKPGDDFRLDTQDAEIRDFVSGLRKKRRRQTVTWLVFAASIIFFLAALAWRLCR